MNLILIGAQGSGKGTQAARLVNALNIHHVSSGDLFRKVSDDNTEFGKKVQSYIDRGELVPDDLTIAMVLDRISEPDCVRDGFILDGFPRTIPQAQALDEGLQQAGRSIDCGIYLDVPRAALLKRLSGRYICRAQQHVYNIETNPPKVPGVCDVDGSELYQRPDDEGPKIERRLDIFFSETIHLLDYYRGQGKLLTVNGDGDIDQVTHDVLAHLKQKLHGSV